MTDLFNKLPIDPDWLREVDAQTNAAAAALGCMVVLIAVQQDGKLCVTVEGVPASGPLMEMSKDVPKMLYLLSLLCAAQEGEHKGQTRQ